MPKDTGKKFVAIVGLFLAAVFLSGCLKLDLYENKNPPNLIQDDPVRKIPKIKEINYILES